MKPELQRIAIAEACGWRCCQDSSKYGLGMLAFPPNYDGDLNTTIGLQKIPDYLNDLNAMHEAEKVILDKDDGTWGVYVYELGEIGRTSVLPRIHTTAAQRAEAFLRTIGKWEETQP